MPDSTHHRLAVASFILGILGLALLIGPAIEYGGFAIGATLVLLLAIVVVNGYLIVVRSQKR